MNKTININKKENTGEQGTKLTGARNREKGFGTPDGEKGTFPAVFLQNVSDELRAPLTVIKGFVTTLLQPDIKWTGEEEKDFLMTIDQEADHLERLISVLTDTSFVEDRPLPLEADACQVTEILRSVQATLTTITRYHRLQFRIPPGLPSVFADPRRVGMVLVILIDNAVRNSEEGACIEVSVKSSGREVTVSIISQKCAEPVRFEHDISSFAFRFERAAAGASLEMPYCRRVIEAHGGRIWAEISTGDGTRLNFSLPVSGERNVDEPEEPDTVAETRVGER